MRRRRHSPARQASAVALVLAVVLGVAVVGGGPPSDDEPAPSTTAVSEAVPDAPARTGSAEVATDPDWEPEATVPSTYRVVRRISEAGGSVRTEQVWVRRPFDSRVEVEGVASVRESRLHRVATRTDGSTNVFVAPTAIASPDARFGPVLTAAVDTGVVERREQRRVAGRRCQVLRLARPTGEGPLVDRPTAADHADACVDATGLVLEEWWVADGRPVRQTVVTEVAVDEPVPDDRFTLPLEPTLGPDQGGGGVRPLAPDSVQEGPAWRLPSPPEGFAHQGRWLVVPAQAGLADPASREDVVASVVDVWVSGPDVLVLDQGGTLGGGPAFDDVPGAATVDAGAMGRAQLLLRPAGSEVRAALDGGRFVVVRGTLPPARLVDVARAVEPVDGTGLVYLG